MIKFLDDTTMAKDIFLNEIKYNPQLLEQIEQNEQICLEAVKQYGLTLKYVKKQNEQICLEAIKQDKLAIQYVDDSIIKLLNL